MPVTVEVLDVTHGRPAADVRVRLEQSQLGRGWAAVAEAATDDRGRIEAFERAPDEGCAVRLVVDARRFFAAQGLPSTQADITIAIGTTNPALHHHVPVLLAPFGYCTYTGLSS